MYDAGFLDIFEQDEVRTLDAEKYLRYFLTFAIATPIFAFRTPNYYYNLFISMQIFLKQCRRKFLGRLVILIKYVDHVNIFILVISNKHYFLHDSGEFLFDNQI